MNEAEFLKTRYGVAIAEPEVLRTLQSKRVVLHIKCDMTYENDTLLDSTWNEQVHLVAIVVDSYSLLNTDGPVSITLSHSNESNKLNPTCSFKNNEVHDVVFPGKQDFSSKVWFKIQSEKLDSIKQYGFSKEDYHSGLIRNGDDDGDFIFVTYEPKIPNVADSPPYCPLGFVIHQLKNEGDPAFELMESTTFKNNKGRQLLGYMLKVENAEELLSRFDKIVDDHRPLVTMSTLNVNCNGHASKFSLCVALDVYYNPLPKKPKD